jgi:hypothetical protein
MKVLLEGVLDDYRFQISEADSTYCTSAVPGDSPRRLLSLLKLQSEPSPLCIRPEHLEFAPDSEPPVLVAQYEVVVRQRARALGRLIRFSPTYDGVYFPEGALGTFLIEHGNYLSYDYSSYVEREWTVGLDERPPAEIAELAGIIGAIASLFLDGYPF